MIMELFEAIAARHSYRGEFAKTPIPREHLEKIVQAGIQAPSACNEQVASFVIIDDRALIKQIADIVDKPVCRSATAMIVSVADPRPVVGRLSFAEEDCAAAVENIWLALTALGYATVWLDGVLRGGDCAGQIGRLLNVPAGRSVLILLPIGVPVEKIRQREKLPFAQRAWFNRYGG
jgi:nitroreductase